MDIFEEFRAKVVAALQRRIDAGDLPTSLDLTRFVVEPPRDAANGDIANNAALVYAREAKAAGSSVRELAHALAKDLETNSQFVLNTAIAGPGFINVRLNPDIYEGVLREILEAGTNYGRATRPAEGKVNVEYVSANPTGPMHVGHARGAVFGDALANLLVFAGRAVTREYYVNDAGAQVDVLARSAFLRYREALGESVTIPEGFYPGDYLKPLGAALAAEFGASLRDKPEAEWLAPVRARAITAMMAMIKDDLAALNIVHEVFSSERALTGGDGGEDQVRAAIEDLRRRDIVYVGRLPPPKGQPSEDWEDREQTLFRSTEFGDDVDRPLIKSDGGYTYFASDIAYHKSKIDRGFLTLIDVWGADHGGYVKRMQAAVAALSVGKASLDVKLCQLVRLMRAGEPVKMSKRSGEFVTLREVVDEVGADPARFIMLMRKNDAPLDFDLAKVIEQTQDNPVFYVQYAHARARSVLRQTHTAFPDVDLAPKALCGADFGLLSDEGERGLMRALAQYPRIIVQAAEAHEPHRIAFYAHDLATLFHAHWNRGKDSPHLRFVNEGNASLTNARIGLVTAVAFVLASALTILGVSAPEEMR